MTGHAPPPGGALSPRLAGFFAFLRGRGLAVGVGAELDLGRALGHVPVTERRAFRDACRITLAKSPADLALLDAAFDAYWSPRPAAGIEEPAAGRGIPHTPPADAVPSSLPPARPPPLSIDARGVVRIGVYSPDAPPASHPFARLDARRLAALRAGARRFRRFAAALPGRRFAPSAHGEIDFPATARRSLRHGGEWVELRRRRRRPLRSAFVILWDVSGSMRDHDSDLLALVYSLHRASRAARVFAFSTDLQEVTERLRGRPYARAGEAVARHLRYAGGGTRIGRCLREFRRQHGRLVHGHTTVVVVSDGWDLGDAPWVGEEVGWLRRKAHLVAWINPYARKRGFRPETAAMQEALPHLDVLLAPEDFETRRPFRPPGAPRRP